MSDTSIVYGASDDYEMQNNSYRKRSNCWTRIGANICVGVLTFLTILLLIALLFTFYRQYEMEKLRRLKAQKKGKKFNLPASAGSIFDLAKDFFGGSSDSGEILSDIDDYID
jgi:hypothetical protein